MNPKLVVLALLSWSLLACQSSGKQQLIGVPTNNQKQSEPRVYLAEVKAIVKKNVVLPDNIKGNPYGVYTIEVSPKGEVLRVVVQETSGNRALDEAVVAGIKKSSPLPPPRPVVQFLNITYVPF